VSDLTSADRVRPSTVTISSYLLYFVALLQLIGALTTFAIVGTYQRVFNEAFEGTEAEGAGSTIAVISLVVPVVLGVLLAVGLIVLATFNNRGRNGSRITTWVIGGILLCCSGFGVLGSAFSSSMNFGSGTSDPNVPDSAEIQRRLEDELPGWFNPVSITLSVLTVLALLGAIILLALPASNAFFRKQPAGWEPPVPGSAYPGYPQEPGYPPSSTPYQPGEPPLPPPPGSGPGSGPPSGPPPGPPGPPPADR
jgi:hypothetical protein